MREGKGLFEEEIDEEAYQLDILQELIKLNQQAHRSAPNPVPVPTPIKAPESHKSPSRHDPEDDSYLQSVSCAPSPLKSRSIRKSKPKQSRKKRVNDNEMHFSNMSGGGNDERSIGSLSLPYAPPQQKDSIQRSTEERIAEKMRSVRNLREDCAQMQKDFCERESKFKIVKNKQKEALRAALLQSTRLRIEQQMTSPNYTQTNALGRLEANLSFLRSEEPKARVRKGKKTHTASDEEELRMSESLERERKPFLQAVAAKLQKAKDKLIFNCAPFIERPISHLPPAKLEALTSIPKLNDILFLSSIEPVHRNIPQIMGVELQGLSDISVSCLRFPPTASHQKRQDTLVSFVEITQTGKKLLGGPAKSLFPARSLSFLPVWGLALAEDELLLINQLPENLTPLSQFLGQLDVGVGEQHLAVVRYLVRGCLKAIQQAGAQGLVAILLPSSLFINQRYEPRIRNALYALLLLQQFPHLLTEEDLAFYPPEQRPEPAGAALWSLGILAHYLCYGTLPFPKYQPMSWTNREEFLVLNQLQTPTRTAPYEKCREFIHHCLARTGNLSLQELTHDPFLGYPR